MKILIKNGTLVTANKKFDVLKADLLIENGIIKKISKNISNKDAKVVDATDQFVTPGFVQAHTHLCQVLFRGLADDLPLLTWLKKKIWPMEYAHNKASLKASSLLGLLEMQKLGTTSILDMATTKHTEQVFDAVKESKMRYVGGPCFMDDKPYSGPLYKNTKTTIQESEDLYKTYHKSTDLIDYALCPRFAISCTDEMMRYSAEFQKDNNIIIHTHASENLDEIAIVKKKTGHRNISYFHKLNMLNSKTVIVHGIHLNKTEIGYLKKAKSPIVHCPSSNLKLASGIASTHEYLKENLTVSLGSDGAPCNNTMDPFMEMRLAALIQKPIFGSTALPAKKAFAMATINGAKTIGKD
ncbi:amidohydrolase family protein, partial [bacterium]|nr:amidohydrolase family protein [bacterium]